MSKRLADDVQELALRCGYAATVVLTPGRDLYRVNIRRAVEAKLSEPERVMYAGTVHCIDVKNHVICVRRGGRAAWCGNCYDEGKRCAEALAVSWQAQYGTDVRIVRIFNTYGPRMHPNDGRVVSNFIVQALKGEPISIYGDGEQTRSFCYVDDLIDGFVKTMGRASLDGPVNLGNPTEVTVLSLAESVRRMTGSRSEIVRRPLPKDDPIRRKPDITRATTLLGWSPRVQLEEGLGKTIEYFRTLLSAER
jgi:UDP-glucuronate decarboxylase